MHSVVLVEPKLFLAEHPELAPRWEAACQVQPVRVTPVYTYYQQVSDGRFGLQGRGDYYCFLATGKIGLIRTREASVREVTCLRLHRTHASTVSPSQPYDFLRGHAIPGWVTTENAAAYDQLVLDRAWGINLELKSMPSNNTHISIQQWMIERERFHGTLLTRVNQGNPNFGSSTSYILLPLVAEYIRLGLWRNNPDWPNVPLSTFYFLPLPIKLQHAWPTTQQALPKTADDNVEVIRQWLGACGGPKMSFWLEEGLRVAQNNFRRGLVSHLSDVIDPTWLSFVLGRAACHQICPEGLERKHDFWLLFSIETFAELNWYTLMHLIQSPGAYREYLSTCHLKEKEKLLPQLPKDNQELLAFLETELPKLSPAAMYTVATA